MLVNLYNCNWYDPAHPEFNVRTFAQFQKRYPSIYPEVLIKMGLKPIYYDLPTDYDKKFYTTAPIGTLNNIEDMTENEDGVLVQSFEVVELPLDRAKQNCIEPLAQARYDKEVGGCEITGIDGLTEFPTDREKRHTIAELALAGGDVDYKLDNGTFIHLTAAQVASLNEQINAHVQSAYSREFELKTAIENATSIDELAGLDLTF